MSAIPTTGFLVVLVMALMGGKLEVSGEVVGPQTYPFGFMNITTDRTETGFIQIFGYAINLTTMLVEGNNESFNQFKRLSVSSSQMYNFTPPFGNILRQSDPAVTTNPVNNFGIIGSSSDPMYLIGVKSDKGTTDAFMTLPVVDTSTEFFIAGWPKVQERGFLAVIMVVGALDDTCVEVYKIFNGDKFVLLNSQSGRVGRFQIYRYFALFERYENETQGNGDEDVTGYFVNSTKPVAVYFGHECAWVPTTATLFCDYIVEQIPPVSQLGQRHVVPPILGRNRAGGYIVRVVPTQPGTTEISYMGTKSSKVRGQWLEFNQPLADTATLVECSQKCLVMQYNKGYLTVANDNPTDPFMQLVVADDRFTAGSGFATANFCQDRNSLIEFDNFIAIVTFDNYKQNIRFDDQPLTAISQLAQPPSWQTVKGSGVTYAVTSFRVTHGFHYVNFAPGTFGSFAVYVYGHSIDFDSSSAYGYSANYNITGNSISETWTKGLQKYDDSTDSDLNITCQSESQLTGAIISSGFGQYVPYPFTLRASIQPPTPLTVTCLNDYQTELLRLLREFSRKINYWICISKNCSFLDGVGVAIDYDSLKVQWIGSGGVYSAVEVYVKMMASMDVSAANFAQCRADIMNYMYYFINWPPYYTENLITKINAGCPWPIKFSKPQFDAMQQQCPVIA